MVLSKRPLDEMIEQTAESNAIFKGRVISVYDDKVTLPDGGIAGREIVRHNGGVCCAVLDDKDRLAFVSQYRYAYGQVVSELPAGKLEIGEEPDDAIKREVREEVGALCTDWRKMGVLYPSPGYCNEVIHLYACRMVSQGETDPDEDENLDIAFIPLREAVRMVMRGELPDSKTQALVLKLAVERGIRVSSNPCVRRVAVRRVIVRHGSARPFTRRHKKYF